jgi:hypothetical protein
MEWLIPTLTFLGGLGVRHLYHIISGRKLEKWFEKLTSDNVKLRETIHELMVMIARSDRFSKKEKEYIRADADERLKEVFHTFPWEAEYAREIAGEADIKVVVTPEKSPRKKGSEGEGGSPMEF